MRLALLVIGSAMMLPGLALLIAGRDAAVWLIAAANLCALACSLLARWEKPTSYASERIHSQEKPS